MLGTQRDESIVCDFQSCSLAEVHCVWAAKLCWNSPTAGTQGSLWESGSRVDGQKPSKETAGHVSVVRKTYSSIFLPLESAIFHSSGVNGKAQYQVYWKYSFPINSCPWNITSFLFLFLLSLTRSGNLTTGMTVLPALCLLLETLNWTFALGPICCMQTITNMMSSTSHMDVLFHSSSIEKVIIWFICLVRFWLLFPILLAPVPLVLWELLNIFLCTYTDRGYRGS